MHRREYALVGFDGSARKKVFSRQLRLMRRPENVQRFTELELRFEQLMNEDLCPPRNSGIKRIGKVKNAQRVVCFH